ncbi:Transcriptional regulator, MarR family [hydrothermal vent metagenome]|uniref:Transcriptional regulator, MarR family n=1 Tax=hydrothermal vent metagenome TaxID=652676 RepID=A0A3B0SDB9_9ZZZZ
MTSSDEGSRNLLQLQDFLPYRLSVVSNQVSNLIADLYQDRFGLSIWQWRVIAMLGSNGSRTAQQIAAQAAMDKMTVSRSVSALLKRDLINRAPSQTDRRSHILRLTATGQKIHDEIAPLARKQEQVLLSGMSQRETKQLFSLLERLEQTAVKAHADKSTF